MDKMIILSIIDNNENEKEGECDFFIDDDNISMQSRDPFCKSMNDRILYILTKKFVKKNLLDIKWAMVFPRVAKIGNDYKMLILFNERSEYAITNFLLNLFSDNTSISPIISIDYLDKFEYDYLHRILEIMNVNLTRIEFDTSSPNMKFLQRSRRTNIEDNQFFIYFSSTKDISIIDYDTLFTSLSDSMDTLTYLIREYKEKKILLLSGLVENKRGVVNILRTK